MNDSVITRRHWQAYKPSCQNAPPPLHVRSVNPQACHVALPRPLEGGAAPGPSLVLGGTGMPGLGVDPTDPSTWGARGYNTSPGMIGWLNGPIGGLQGGDYGTGAFGQ